MAPVAFPASVASALVCESLHPDHMMTSAGDVLVCFVFSAAPELPPMTDFPILPELVQHQARGRSETHPMMPFSIPLVSPLFDQLMFMAHDHSSGDIPEVAHSCAEKTLSSFSQ